MRSWLVFVFILPIASATNADPVDDYVAQAQAVEKRILTEAGPDCSAETAIAVSVVELAINSWATSIAVFRSARSFMDGK